MLGYIQLTTEVAPGAGTRLKAIENPDGSFTQLVDFQRPNNIALSYDPVTQNITQVVYTFADNSTLTLTLTYDSFENLIGVAAA